MEAQKKEKNIVLIISVFVITLIVFALGWYLFELKYPSKQNPDFPDKFAAISALFTGLAFAGVICTIILQSRELKLQRQELEDTREELKGQKEAAQKQNELLERQRFENTFFNLLQNLSSFMESFEGGNERGLKSFNVLRDILNSNLYKFASDGNTMRKELIPEDYNSQTKM
ncbi:MAG: hypothetical protein ACK5MH_03520 [Bacteroidales bacterium]